MDMMWALTRREKCKTKTNEGHWHIHAFQAEVLTTNTYHWGAYLLSRRKHVLYGKQLKLVLLTMTPIVNQVPVPPNI